MEPLFYVLELVVLSLATGILVTGPLIKLVVDLKADKPKWLYVFLDLTSLLFSLLIVVSSYQMVF